MKLYIGEVSGNSYKVRILLSLLQVSYEQIVLDMSRQEHKAAEFRKINPRGEVPALVDGELVLWDSAAILVYIARKFGGDTWLPGDPAQMADVMQWVALAGQEMQFGLQYCRRGYLHDRWTLGDRERSTAVSKIALDVLEHRLAGGRQWLVLDRPTIADIACFPYSETAPEAKIPLEAYPNIMAWHARCRALPRWATRAL